MGGHGLPTLQSLLAKGTISPSSFSVPSVSVPTPPTSDIEALLARTGRNVEMTHPLQEVAPVKSFVGQPEMTHPRRPLSSIAGEISDLDLPLGGRAPLPESAYGVPAERDVGLEPVEQPEGLLDVLGRMIGDANVQRFLGTALTGAIGGGGPKGARNVQEFQRTFEVGRQAEAEARKLELEQQQVEDQRKYRAESISVQREKMKADREMQLAAAIHKHAQDLALQGKKLTPEQEKFIKDHGFPVPTTPSKYAVDYKQNKIVEVDWDNPDGVSETIATANLNTYQNNPELRLNQIQSALDSFGMEGLSKNDIEVLIGVRGKQSAIDPSYKHIESNGRYVFYDTTTGTVVETDIPAEPPTVSPDTAKLLGGLENSGIPSIDELIEIIEDEGLKLVTPWGRRSEVGLRMQRLATNVADIVGRIRSGGAINDQEMENFTSLLGLTWTDAIFGSKEATIEALKDIKNMFVGVYNLASQEPHITLAQIGVKRGAFSTQEAALEATDLPPGDWDVEGTLDRY